MDTNKATNRDLVIGIIGGLFVLYMAHNFDLFEYVVSYVTSHESWEADELFILSVYLTVALSVFSFRRWKEALEEIDKRKALEKDLIIAKNEADTANRTKGKFLADMSHELRTPLNSIIGFSEMLLDEAFGTLDKRQNRYVNNIHKSGNHLLNLINQLLDLSKIESGKVELHLEEFEIDILFEEINEVLDPLAKRKYIDLTYVSDPQIRVVNMDKIKMKQILFNLASNALKFTPEDGSVDIGVQKKGDLMQICITDSGPGIDEQGLKKIFEPFEQLGTNEGSEYKGTGLGLAIVRELVEMQKGHVWAESEPGKGTSFFLELPMNISIDG
ncbi:HAMP domain-containing sensor histidine kinase [Methanolobus sp. WCC4]|uniref:sensor histidine kinase n=1 Tax=Methanolobus sp. WCC4 TaxID=3125784 RepID=UPI0030F85CB8